MPDGVGGPGRAGTDARWLTVLAAATLFETGWWAIAWSAGIAPFPFVLSYIGLAALGLAVALLLTRLLTG